MNKRQIGIYGATTIAAFIAISAISMVATPRAYAEPSTSSQTGVQGVCWGYQTNQLAMTGTLGQHASDPTGTGTPGSDTPRTGLGNLVQNPDVGNGTFAGLVSALTGETCFQ